MKKLLACLLATTICLSCTAVASANDSSSDYRVCYSSDEAVIRSNATSLDDTDYQNMKDSVKMVFTGEDGTEIPLAVDMTVTELPVSTRSAAGDRNYRLTATASTSKMDYGEGEVDQSKVAGTISIVMEWTDVLGPKNVITWLSGRASVTKGLFGSGRYYWGSTGTLTYLKADGRKTITSTSFGESMNYTSTSGLGTVSAGFDASFKEVGYFILSATVTPSVFD